MKLLGAVEPDELPALIRAADAVVHVPWVESAGDRAPIAAMACGMPVVVSTVGGMADSVVDGVTGVAEEADYQASSGSATV